MNLDPHTDVAIGEILRPWGRFGAVVVAPLTDDPRRRYERLDAVGVRAGSRATWRRVREVRFDRRERPLVRLEGVDSINDAEALRGARLVVPERAAERPAGDVYFNHELVGSEVRSTAGEELGRVDGIVETAAGNLLVIKHGERELLVPTVRSVMVEVDVAAHRVVVELPAGLLELNAVGGQRGAERAV